MIKDKQLARQVRDIFLDIARLHSRARQVIKDSNCSVEERKALLDKIFVDFDDPLAGLLAEIYVEHNDLPLQDEGHPPGFFEKIKKDRSSKQKS